jgi:hypothetical protein
MSASAWSAQPPSVLSGPVPCTRGSHVLVPSSLKISPRKVCRDPAGSCRGREARASADRGEGVTAHRQAREQSGARAHDRQAFCEANVASPPVRARSQRVALAACTETSPRLVAGVAPSTSEHEQPVEALAPARPAALSNVKHLVAERVRLVDPLLRERWILNVAVIVSSSSVLSKNFAYCAPRSSTFPRTDEISRLIRSGRAVAMCSVIARTCCGWTVLKTRGSQGTVMRPSIWLSKGCGSART